MQVPSKHSALQTCGHERLQKTAGVTNVRTASLTRRRLQAV